MVKFKFNKAMMLAVTLFLTGCASSDENLQETTDHHETVQEVESENVESSEVESNEEAAIQSEEESEALAGEDASVEITNESQIHFINTGSSNK